MAFQSVFDVSQVHGKRFAVLTRLIDEIEASLSSEEANVVDCGKLNPVDQSDGDSSERSMQ